MYTNTRFGELLKVLPRAQFQRCVDRHCGDRFSKGFRCYDQLIAMMFGQLSGARSLRELESGFNANPSAHYHLGSRAIKRSTLADANTKRDASIYLDFCQHLLSSTHRTLRGEVADLLYLIDSTAIPLRGYGYEWTHQQSRARTPGLKLHIKLDANANTPSAFAITPSNINDVHFGQNQSIEQHATYVFDKAYCDYRWWYHIQCNNAYFVTRFKRNAGVDVIEQRVISDHENTIIGDDIVVFRNQYSGKKRKNPYQEPLRRIVVDRGDKPPLILATNDMERCASDIAECYKNRWAIELWFKWIKQNLKIKKFIGTSENAVRIQLLTALITYMLLRIYRQAHQLKDAFYLWLKELQLTLLQSAEPTSYQHHKRRCRVKKIIDKQQMCLTI